MNPNKLFYFVIIGGFISSLRNLYGIQICIIDNIFFQIYLHLNIHKNNLLWKAFLVDNFFLLNLSILIQVDEKELYPILYLFLVTLKWILVWLYLSQFLFHSTRLGLNNCSRSFNKCYSSSLSNCSSVSSSEKSNSDILPSPNKL